MSPVLLVHAAATLALAGLIWFVQIVHYPLFARVGREAFASYHRAHTRLTTFVVAPLMLGEGATALALAVRTPAGVSPALAWTGLGLVALIWISTAFAQAPRHRELALTFDPSTHRALVLGNWVRTVAWTARAVLALHFLSPSAV